MTSRLLIATALLLALTGAAHRAQADRKECSVEIKPIMVSLGYGMSGNGPERFDIRFVAYVKSGRMTAIAKECQVEGAHQSLADKEVELVKQACITSARQSPIAQGCA